MCCIHTRPGYFVRIYTFKSDGWLKWKVSGVSWPGETALACGALIGLISITVGVRAPADTEELWGDWKLRLMYALILALRTWNNYNVWYYVRYLFSINQIKACARWIKSQVGTIAQLDGYLNELREISLVFVGTHECHVPQRLRVKELDARDHAMRFVKGTKINIVQEQDLHLG
jgi:hypothetical protein